MPCGRWILICNIKEMTNSREIAPTVKAFYKKRFDISESCLHNSQGLLSPFGDPRIRFFTSLISRYRRYDQFNFCPRVFILILMGNLKSLSGRSSSCESRLNIVDEN